MHPRRQLRRSSVVVAATLTLGIAATGCAANQQTDSPRSTIPITARPTVPTTRRPAVPVVVPGYVAPSNTAYWHAVLGSAPTVRHVILNPSNGPGSVAQTGYRTLLTQLRGRGIQVLGYVVTGAGHRSRSAVKADIARWRSFYDVTSVFFDEVSGAVADMGTYRDYATTVHADGGIAVLNPGVVPAQGYFAFADAVVTFEDSATRYLKAPHNPSWLSREPRSKVWNIIIDVPRDQLTQVLANVATHNACEIYLTNDNVPNPYDTLPSFWAQETSRDYLNLGVADPVGC